MEALKLVSMLAEGFQGPGGAFMWCTLLLGMFGLAIAIERGYYLYFHCGMGRQKFMTDLFNIIKTGDFNKAVRFCNNYSMPLAKMMGSLITVRDKGEKALGKVVDEVFVTEVPRIQRYTPLIAVVANLATLMGLLGTIFGLILSFDAVANVPAAQRSQALSAGIGVAMTSTAFGLTIAVCAIFVNGLYVTQTDRLIEELDEKSTKMINILTTEEGHSFK
jgi:biopolymer transport protein ExbB